MPDEKQDAFELGRLHGRVSALESKVDRQESLLSGIDKKVDDVLIALASAVGGRDKIRVLLKYTGGLISAAGALAIIAGAFHFGAGH